MNFIQVQTNNGKTILLNLSTVTTIMPKSINTSIVCFYGDDCINLDEKYEDLVNIIESVQRRNGK